MVLLKTRLSKGNSYNNFPFIIAFLAVPLQGGTIYKKDTDCIYIASCIKKHDFTKVIQELKICENVIENNCERCIMKTCKALYAISERIARCYVWKEKCIMQEKQYVMALDAGTTSNRAIIFDNESHIVSVSQKEFTQYFQNRVG